jgi:hypothetical protein
VREARDEAKKEIEAYRAKKEAEYKRFEAEVLSTTSCPATSRERMLMNGSTHKATSRPRRKPTAKLTSRSKRSGRLLRRVRTRSSRICSRLFSRLSLCRFPEES